MYLRQSISINWEDEKIVEEVLNFLSRKAKEHGVWFVRISTMLSYSEKNRDLFREYGLKESFSPSIDAQRTVIIRSSQKILIILQWSLERILDI